MIHSKLKEPTFKGEVWDLIIFILDHCLFFTFRMFSALEATLLDFT